ncbi:MAG: polyphosphate kinase 1, partial [Ruminiclostridium sp.]|nr:polyphosphate kinase 1 [Ruminiclostridium sp.]
MVNLCFENRELSWLRFNERVLEEAEDERIPLCERLSFLSIFQSNLDEFFMVRIGSLHDQMLLDSESRDTKTMMTPAEQINAAAQRARALCERRDETYRSLISKLEEQGVSLVDIAELSGKSEKYLRQLFKNEYMPLLSTFVVGKKQSFPFLQNKEIYAVATLSAKSGKGEKSDKTKIGIVPCGGSVFPRLIPIPDRKGCFLLAEELILHYLPLIFSGYKVRSSALVRITRNADIDADSIYDEDLNYRDHMAEVVKLRKKLSPVRIEVKGDIDDETVKNLCSQIKLDSSMVFTYDTPLDVSFFSAACDQLRSRSELFYAPRHPRKSPDFDESRSILDQIEEDDKMLHYPYQSIRPFLMML